MILFINLYDREIWNILNVLIIIIIIKKNKNSIILIVFKKIPLNSCFICWKEIIIFFNKLYQGLSVIRALEFNLILIIKSCIINI